MAPDPKTLAAPPADSAAVEAPELPRRNATILVTRRQARDDAPAPAAADAPADAPAEAPAEAGAEVPAADAPAEGSTDATEEARARAALGRADEGEAIEIDIALSSEAPVERMDWWTGERYIEVLGHGPGEVNLDYARDGLPFLISHDQTERFHLQAGIVEGIRIDSDRRSRGRVRFSRNEKAQSIRQDMLDDIRKKVSVGYDPGDEYTQTEEGGVKTRRYTNWRLLEVSSVPIPADYDVGKGRSARPGVPQADHSSGHAARKAKEIRMGTTATPAPAGADRKTDQQEIAVLARQHGLTERLPEWIGASATLEQVRNEILEFHQKRTETVIRSGGEKGVVQLSDKEEQQYSIQRAILSVAGRSRAGLEFEVSQEIAKRLGKAENELGFFVPTTLRKAVGSRRHQTRAAPLAVGASAGGAELVFTEYGGFIPLLRNKARVLQMGARLLSGLQGNVGFTTQTSANPFVWGSETSNPTATAFATGLRTMTPKVGAAVTSFTRQLLTQSVESVEDLVWDDLVQIAAIAIDAAAIAGPGTASTPTGIIYTTGTGAVTIGTAGGALAFSHCVGLETEITNDNADVASMGLLTTPGVAGQLKQTQQFSGTNGVPIWTGTVHDGLVNGYRASITKQVPSTITKGSNTGVLHAAVFGAWSELFVGEWGAMEMIVDPFTLGPTQIKVSTMLMVDIMLRYIESFSTCEEILVS